MWVLMAGGAVAAPPMDLDDLSSTMLDHTGRWEIVRPAAGPAADDGPDRVVGGTVVTDGHDNVVALAGLDPITGEMFVFCSGSQIAPDWVLTAAHCVTGSSGVTSYGMELHVLYGDDIAHSGFTDAVAIVESVYNPAYNPTQITDDSGLVRLEEPRPEVRWMVLNDAPLDPTWIGLEVDFYGFGVTSDGGVDAGTKRTTTAAIHEVTSQVITTYMAGTNVCSGDSGGPSTYDGPKGPEQVGVNSYVIPGCAGGSAGSTRIDTQLPWIQGYVPGVALDYDDLPVDEVVGEGGGRSWLDLGIEEDVPGLGGAWPERSGGVGPHGCDHLGSPGAGAGAGLVLLAARRRRAGPRRERVKPEAAG